MMSKIRKQDVRTFKRTPQRLAIIEHLDGNTTHPSAEDIFRSVSRKHPSMSFATVYNTLNTLVRAGAVRELTIDPDRRRYDPDTSAHHHLICMHCRKIVDITADIPVVISKGMAREFAVIGSHIEFYGICAPCRRKKRNKGQCGAAPDRRTGRREGHHGND
jgi:Fur family peroxide stress response transcriptional regulator